MVHTTYNNNHLKHRTEQREARQPAHSSRTEKMRRSGRSTVCSHSVMFVIWITFAFHLCPCSGPVRSPRSRLCALESPNACSTSNIGNTNLGCSTGRPWLLLAADAQKT